MSNDARARSTSRRAWFERRTEPPMLSAFHKDEPPAPVVKLSIPPPAGADAVVIELARARESIAALEARLCDAQIENERLRSEAQRSRDAADRVRLDADECVAAAMAEREAHTKSLEKRLFDLAMTIARKIVGRELATTPALVAEWVRDTLRAVGLVDAVVVANEATRAALVDAGFDPHAVQTMPTFADGECEIQTATQAVAVSADARFEALEDEAA